MRKQVRQVRQHLGLNQVEFAARLGVSPRSVQYWESGLTVPRVQSLRTIAALGGRPVSWFYEEELVA